jgi:5'(3')-deoxyribonucleotidase
MKKLTILIDMDDTIENLVDVWIEFLNKKHGTNVHRDDVIKWDISEAFPSLSLGDIYAPLSSEELWETVTTLPGAVENMQRLISDGHKLVIVTASHQDTVPLKLNNVLFKYFPFITMDDVIIAKQKQLINGDILIDDAPHNLEGGSYKGILMSAPHNKSYNAQANGFIRANNWDEIYAAIYQIAQDLSDRIAQNSSDRIHARWEFRGGSGQCSNCHMWFNDVCDVGYVDEYCRHCGAKMDEV